MRCRLALGTSDSAKSVPYLHNHFKDDIRSLAKFVDDSPTRNTHLREVQLSLQDHEHKLCTVADTRWLRYVINVYGDYFTVCECSHGRLVAALLVSLPAVYVFLVEEAHNPKGVGKATAIGLTKQLSAWKFVSSLILFGDVLPEIDRLCRIFQTIDLDLFQQFPAIFVPLLPKSNLSKKNPLITGFRVRIP